MGLYHPIHSMRARQRQISEIRLATPRPGQDMVDLKATYLALGG